MALDGELLGQTVAGPRQRTAQLAPKLSSLALTFEKQDATVLNFQPYSPTPPSITFGQGILAAADSFALGTAGDPVPLRGDRIANVILSSELFTSGGFGSITVNNPDGNILVPADVELKAPARGSLTLTAANLDLQGKITAPNGSLSFTAYNFTPYQDHEFPDGVKATPAPDPTRGNLVLGANALLNTAGLIVDDRPLAANPLSLPLAIDGGSISVAGYNVALQKGSVLDASGGVAFAKDGKRTFGAGGSISIKAGNDPKALQIVGGTLELEAQLGAFSGTKGGSLTIQAPSIQIGGTEVASKNTLLLNPDFFRKGGFTSYSLIGLGEKIEGENFKFVPGIVVTPGTTIHPVAESWMALSYAGSGGSPRLQALLQPQSLRSPTSLSLSAPGVRDEFNNNTLVTAGRYSNRRGCPHPNGSQGQRQHFG
jgi:hypothetical protein